MFGLCIFKNKIQYDEKNQNMMYGVRINSAL